MRYKVYGAIVFFFILFYVLNAGPYFCIGIDYVAKNIYIDNEGLTEEENGVPLLGVGLGYNNKIGMFNLTLDTHSDFFGMDLIKGNRELTLFFKPCALISVPIKIGEINLSPIIGYGGIYKKRYIKERTFLKGQDRYINSVDYEENTYDILYGGFLSLDNWLKTSFITLKDISVFHTVSLFIRTPECEKQIPYIFVKYTGAEGVSVITIGLTFFK